MRVQFLSEPELEFAAGGQHVDIRYGLMNHGPLDYASPTAPRRIRLGVIGTPESVEGLTHWLERCRTEIPAKETDLITLFPHFPGFSEDHTFRSTLALHPTLNRVIPNRTFEILTKNDDYNAMLESVLDLVMAEMNYLAETIDPDVIALAMPQSLFDRIDERRGQFRNLNRDGQASIEFHDALKARAMQIRRPTQLIWPSTYDPTKAGKKRRGNGTRKRQDDATRAWNMHAALYYKAGGTPYRVIRAANDLETCYVGVSFYRSLDGEKMMTSLAQVFNQRGEGVIVRGGPAEESKEDKQSHLTEEDALKLLENALDTYRHEHKHAPARVVLHKSSNYNQAERDGFNAALDAKDIESSDFIAVRKSGTRLFRTGENPPLRGTMLSLDENSHVLYTRGSVDFYRVYPGLYVPRPMYFQCDQREQSPSFLAAELLTLSKINYNNTQLDGAEPMTLRVAKRVGDILRYVREEDLVVPGYKFYM
jgi:hypothetical protein